MKNIIFAAFMAGVLIAGCSPSQQTTENEQGSLPNTDGEEVYLFEETESDSTATAAAAPSKVEYEYSIQLGAFASQQMADSFAEKSKKKFGSGIYVKMKEDVGLYAVILGPIPTHESAEDQLNQLRAQKDYKDAFLIREVKQTVN
jgi:cell division septation protein DedD